MISTYQGSVALVLFDVDGVLTDGKLLIGSDGEAYKSFNVKDGVAVSLLRAHNIRCGIISGKSSPSLDYRIRELKFDLSVTNCKDKLKAYSEIKTNHRLNDSQIVFVGDDIIDLPVMNATEICYAPSDAHPLILRAASFVTSCIGGSGVAREVAEHILAKGSLTLEAMYAPLLDGSQIPHQ